jgi:lipoate-protein ligase B
MTTITKVLDLSYSDYKTVWDLQLQLAEKRSAGQIPDTLVLVEHPHVFTLGKGVKDTPPAAVEGVPVYRVERGGLWTYHGPGQLVGYPILNLSERGRDIHGYLRDLERTIILTVGKFGITAERREGHTGVWVGPKKLASIGVAVRNWITFHGFALNVNTNLSYFDMIEPCGLPRATLTSMQVLLGREVQMDNVKREFAVMFEGIFETRLEPEASEISAGS